MATTPSESYVSMMVASVRSDVIALIFLDGLPALQEVLIPCSALSNGPSSAFDCSISGRMPLQPRPTTLQLCRFVLGYYVSLFSGSPLTIAQSAIHVFFNG